jgi:hypothetical protein
MSGDTAGNVGLWFLTFYAVALAIPIIVAVILITLLLMGLKLAFLRARDLVQGPPAVRAVRQVERDRDEAVRELIAIRQDATRRMQRIADEDVIEGRAWDA